MGEQDPRPPGGRPPCGVPPCEGLLAPDLGYMRSFASAWPGEGPIAQQPVAQLGWGHITLLIDKFKDSELRYWYAAKAAENGWSRPVLEHHILTRLHERAGAAPNNLEARLPREGTDLAREIAKDPLVLDFLGLTEEADEKAMEEAMTLRMTQTLAEFGPGFAFVGRQYRLSIDGDEDYFIDLLLFHIPSNRYVVVELKARKFRPEHLGQLTSTSPPLTACSASRTTARPWASSSADPKTTRRCGMR